MTKIKTEKFKLESIQYYKIIATNRLKKVWWIYLISIILAIYLLPKFGKDDIATLYVIFGFAYPIYIFIYLYFWTTSKKNRNLFLERQFVIDKDKMVALLDDGSINEIPWHYVQNKVEREEYWLLYIAKSQFIYLPKSAFKTSDEKFFQDILTNLPDTK